MSGVILVDADVVAYRIGFACESKAYVDTYSGEVFKAKDLSEAEKEGLEPTTYIEPDNVVVHTANEFIRSSVVEPMSATFPGWAFRFYLTGSGNFRYDYARIQPYKGNRNASSKPKNLDLIRDFLVDQYGATIINGQEADDEIAIEAYQRFKEGNDDYVIATTDKDLKMIPGRHFDFVKGKGSNITESGADRNFWYQLLVGDRVDNILGVRGIGPVRASNLMKPISGNKSLYQMVREQYRRTYPQGCETHDGKVVRSDDALVENGILLWMRREPDQIWHPGLLT